MNTDYTRIYVYKTIYETIPTYYLANDGELLAIVMWDDIDFKALKSNPEKYWEEQKNNKRNAIGKWLDIIDSDVTIITAQYKYEGYTQPCEPPVRKFTIPVLCA